MDTHSEIRGRSLDQPIQIGIWGTARSGKTTYLVRLYFDFLARPKEWEVYASEEALEFIHRADQEYFHKNVFVEKTHEARDYVFTIPRKRGMERSFGVLS